MPDVSINYDSDEVKALIQADMKSRFGIDVFDDQLMPDINDNGGWKVSVDKGTLDTSKARHVAETD